MAATVGNRYVFRLTTLALAQRPDFGSKAFEEGDIQPNE